MYKGFVAYYHVPTFYPALYVSAFNLSASALCVVGGVALLKRRFFPLTLAAIFLLLASGIAAPIAWSLDGYIWLNACFLEYSKSGFRLQHWFFWLPEKQNSLVVIYPPPTGGRIAKTSPSSSSVSSPFMVVALFPLTRNWRKPRTPLVLRS